MQPLEIGAMAPSLPGVDGDDGPRAVVFYKVTCPVCQMAAPKLASLEAAYPGRVIAIGQDPPAKLAEFDRTYGFRIPATPDLPPYEISNAFGVRVVPTTFLIDGGTVTDVVESWDREALDRLSSALADRLGLQPRAVSDASDGVPPFRPG